MKKSFIAFLFIASCYSLSANAGTNTGPVLVNMFHQNAIGSRIRTDAAMLNPAGCLSDFWYSVNRTTDPMHDDFARTATTAAASEKSITIYLSDTVCEGSYPLITSITFHR